MDLLDLLRLMVRRWYVAAPMVILTLGAVLLVKSSIGPEYKASGSILLVPPTNTPLPQPVPSPGASRRPGNPWLQVGEVSMAQAIVVSINTHAMREKVAAAGGEPEYEVSLVARSSIINIEVATTDAARAQATTKTVLELLGAEVATRQEQYQPRPGEEITTQVLDPGDNVELSSSNVLRAQIVVLAIGLLFAAAATVGYDAIIRRRKAAGRPALGRAFATAIVRSTDRKDPTRNVVHNIGVAPAAAGNGTTTAEPSTISPVFIDAPGADDTVVLEAVRAQANDDK